MANSAYVSIVIRAQDLATKAFRGVQVGAETLKARVANSFTGIAGAAASLGVALSAGALFAFFTRAQTEFENLRARLQTFTGDAASAGAAFNQLAGFAAKTPYELQDVVEAFITLKSAGLEPSMETLTRFGDQAAAFGGSITDMAEAVRAAATGETERLKRFGVTASIQGDRIGLTFRGVTTTVDRSAVSISNYLENLSKANFTGSMERQSATLGGALSNLRDSFFQLTTGVGQQGLGAGLQDAVRGLTKFTDSLRQNPELLAYIARIVVQTFKTAAVVVWNTARFFFTIGTMLVDSFKAVWAFIKLGATATLQSVFTLFNTTVEALNHLPGVSIDFRAPDLRPAMTRMAGQMRDANTSVEEGWRTLGDSAYKIFDTTADLIVATFSSAAGEVRDEAASTAEALRQTGLATGTGAGGGAGGLSNATLQGLKDQLDLYTQAASVEATRQEGLAKLTQLEAQLRTQLEDTNLTLAQQVQLRQLLAKAEEAVTNATLQPLQDQLALNTAALAIDQTRLQGMAGLVKLEQDVRTRLQNTNLTLNEQVALRQLLAKTEDAVNGAVAGTLARDRELNRQLQDTNLSMERRKQLQDELSANKTVRGAAGQLEFRAPVEVVIPPMPQVPQMDDRNGVEQALEGIQSSARAANDEVNNLGSTLDRLTAVTISGFGDAWGQAFTAVGEGAMSVGAAIANSARQAVGDSAAAKGRETMLDATKALAQGLTNPAKLVEAAKLFTVGAGYFALAGALGGRGRGGGAGGGGGRGGGFSDSKSLKAGEDSVGTIVVQGGLLNMSDPRQAQALEDALNKLKGQRRIEIISS